MISSALSSMFQNKNTINLETLRQTIQNIGSLNQIEIMALIDFLKQNQNLWDIYNKSMIHEEIQEILNSLLPIERQTSSFTNNFIEYKNKCNSKNIGISILNYKGQFILTDMITRIILELNTKEQIQSNTLFSLLCYASEGRIMQQMKQGSLLQNGKQRDSFNITIYSDRNRKKSLKYLNQIAQNPIKKKKNNHQKEQITSLSKEQLLMAKYLKSLNITLMKENLIFNNDFIESFAESDDIMLTNLEANSGAQFVVCEIRELDEPEKFSFTDLIMDPYIQKHELKWRKRIRKYKGGGSDEELD